MATRLRRGSHFRASRSSSAGPTSPMRMLQPGCMSAAPAFARARRGSTPVTPSANSSAGSGRHSILILGLISYQSDFGNFFGQERSFDQQIFHMPLTDIDSIAAAAQEAAPEREVCLDILVAIELHATGRLGCAGKGRQGRAGVAPSEPVERLDAHDRKSGGKGKRVEVVVDQG